MEYLYSATNLIQAHNVKNYLATSGIEVRLQGESLAGAVGELPMNLVEIELFVAENDFQKAETLLQKLLADLERPLEHWQCQNCGEKNASSYEFCWQCSADP